MKFFKFKGEIYTPGIYGGSSQKKLFTSYLNVDDIRVISICDDDDYFILATREGGEFQIKKDYLDSLLKLVDPNEKEAKK